MKNNKPKYILLDFDEFSKEEISEEERLDVIADRILSFVGEDLYNQVPILI